MSDSLALRMRPQTIDQVIGQEHLVGPGKIIRRMVEANRLSSMILYGPPGIGKTSIASAIAGTTKYAFRTFNATVDSKKRLQEIAEDDWGDDGKSFLFCHASHSQSRADFRARALVQPRHQESRGSDTD